MLTNAAGATLADGTGAGTITNDDVAPPPAYAQHLRRLRDRGQSRRWRRGAAGSAPSGNQIVDAAGHSVQIAGVNWFGFETTQPRRRTACGRAATRT